MLNYISIWALRELRKSYFSIIQQSLLYNQWFMYWVVVMENKISQFRPILVAELFKFSLKRLRYIVLSIVVSIKTKFQTPLAYMALQYITLHLPWFTVRIIFVSFSACPDFCSVIRPPSEQKNSIFWLICTTDFHMNQI